jgi:hypothetical protein
MRLGRPSSVHARRRVLAAGALVATGLLVAGCTADEPAEPEPSTSTAEAEPTETPEPTPTDTGPAKPERPAAMEQEDAEGAAAAAEYFIEQYDYVMITGDTAEWEAMSHETCGWCAGSIEQAREIAKRDATYEGGTISATIPDPDFYVRDEATGIYPLDVEMDEAATTITDPSGDVLYSADQSVRVNRVEVGRANGSWVIVEIAAKPEG